MALRNALQQLKHGQLSAPKPSVASSKKPPEVYQFVGSQMDLEDDDDLFNFDPLSSSISNKAQTSASTNTLTRSVAHSTGQNAQSKKASGSIGQIMPTPSSMEKLRSFKFTKTQDHVTSVLGKRTSDGSTDDKSDLLPSAKKSAPSDDAIFNDITLDDLMSTDSFDGISDSLNTSTSKDLFPSQAQTNTPSGSIFHTNSGVDLFKAPISRARDPSSATSLYSNTLSTSSQDSKRIPSTCVFSTPPPRNRAFKTGFMISDSHSTPTNRIVTPHCQHMTPIHSNLLPRTSTHAHPTHSKHTPIYSTPQNRPSTGGSIMTPGSRQPTPVVCTPGGPPAVMRTSHSARRKFPGPAGLLPALAPGQCMDNLLIQPPSIPRPASTPRLQRLSVCREVSCEEECFTSGPWVAMLEDLDMNDSHCSALLQYNISNAMAQSRAKRLTKGKVAHLRALLKSIAPAGRNASAVLKDPSGEVLCTIHSKVFEDHQKELQPGAALILRQVSLFSPTPRKHYLNITPDNIIRVYPPQPSEHPPHGPLDLSGIERQFNAENICPVSKTRERPLTTPAPSHTRGQTRNEPSQTTASNYSRGQNSHWVNRGMSTVLKQTLLAKQDSLTMITRDNTSTPISSSNESLNCPRIPNFHQLAQDRGSVANVQSSKDVAPAVIDCGGREGSIFDQFCEDDFDAIISDMGDEDFMHLLT